jgi:DNA-binding IclR family transcriptional regulator
VTLMLLNLPLFDSQPEDICARKHQGAPTSRAAFDSIRSTLPQRRQSALDFIKSRGPHGATADEVAQAFDIPLNAISGRLSELLRDALVTTDGRLRPTRLGHASRVLVAATQ